MEKHPFDERYKLVPRKISSLKAKQPKKPPPKRTKNVGKSKRVKLTTSSSTESPPSDNRDLPSTKLSPRNMRSTDPPYGRSVHCLVKCVNSFNEALIVQERFLKQKAKIQWLKEGYSNSAYFHKVVKSRISRSRIDVITNSVGKIFENERVADAFVDHYEVFLGQDGITQDLDTNELIEHQLTVFDANHMVRAVTTQ
ncbi:hypothetical protein Tco_1131600 [Tanacetum coccineum]